MRVLIDKYIPYLQGVLDEIAEVCMLEPEEFTPATVQTADALIIRTRTKCDAALLDGSKVRFIATATIGTDHIDEAYCRMRGIHVMSCPGCNAQAVCDYVEEVIDTLITADELSDGTVSAKPKVSKTIGIVGVGHVGSLVRKMAERHGLRVVLNDPPLGMNGDVSDCDIITFHTPLTRDGSYPTYHLCDAAFLARCRACSLIINAARGGIVDEQALLDSRHPFVIDTWENEPHIHPTVLQAARLASCHIAGYSIEGKRNASQMCLDGITAFFGMPKLRLNDDRLPQGDNEPGWLNRLSDTLKAHPNDYEQIRKNYKLR